MIYLHKTELTTLVQVWLVLMPNPVVAWEPEPWSTT